MGMVIKKGDKFRVNEDDWSWSGGYSNGDIFTASAVDSDGANFTDNNLAERWIASHRVTFVDDFGDPWDYKPALKIEAGKYYRTRDGRKVGPVKEAPDDVSLEWESPDAYYDANGRAQGLDNKFDLIAEWAEPKTKGCAAAEVDNLRDEYGPVATAPAEPESKFKVGDRVRVVVGEEDAGSEHGAEVGEEHIVTEVTSDGVDTEPWYFFNEEVELVTEPDTTLSVNITADTSELDAEIDRIKRKLKKLSKKARKIGISLDYDLAA